MGHLVCLEYHVNLLGVQALLLAAGTVEVPELAGLVFGMLEYDDLIAVVGLEEHPQFAASVKMLDGQNTYEDFVHEGDICGFSRIWANCGEVERRDGHWPFASGSIGNERSVTLGLDGCVGSG